MSDFPRLLSAAVAQLIAGGAELVLRVRDQPGDAGRLGVGERLGLLFGRGPGGFASRGPSGSHRGGHATLNVDFSAEPLGGGIVGGNGVDLVEQRPRRGEISRRLRAQGVGKQPDFRIRLALRERVAGQHGHRHEYGGEHGEERREEGAGIHCWKVKVAALGKVEG